MTARWWTGNAVGFDTESDGKVPQDARIIQYAVVAVSTNEPPRVLSGLVKPEREIPAEASAVHGISTERACDEGADRETAIREIAIALAERASVSAPVVAHNAFFDLTLIDREMRRLGIGSLGIGQGFRLDGEDHNAGLVTVRVDGRQIGSFPVIDTLTLDKLVDRYRPGSRKLEAAAEHYRVKMDGDAHDAEVDCLASLRIAWRIAQRCVASGTELNNLFADRRRPSDVITAHTSIAHLGVAQLHAALTKAAAEQAEGLREHFIKNDKRVEAAGVSGAWPFQPYN